MMTLQKRKRLNTCIVKTHKKKIKNVRAYQPFNITIVLLPLDKKNHVYEDPMWLSPLLAPLALFI